MRAYKSRHHVRTLAILVGFCMFSATSFAWASNGDASCDDALRLLRSAAAGQLKVSPSKDEADVRHYAMNIDSDGREDTLIVERVSSGGGRYNVYITLTSKREPFVALEFARAIEIVKIKGSYFVAQNFLSPPDVNETPQLLRLEEKGLVPACTFSYVATYSVRKGDHPLCSTIANERHTSPSIYTQKSDRAERARGALSRAAHVPSGEVLDVDIYNDGTSEIVLVQQPDEKKDDPFCPSERVFIVQSPFTAPTLVPVMKQKICGTSEAVIRVEEKIAVQRTRRNYAREILLLRRSQTPQLICQLSPHLSLTQGAAK